MKNKYYNTVVSTKDYLYEFFDTYDEYNNPISIWEFGNLIHEKHNKMSSIIERMAFIATTQLCTFIVHDDGTMVSLRLPSTSDVLWFIERGGFRKSYRHKSPVWLHTEDSWDWEYPSVSTRIL